ncbi:MAG: hypothetical protein OEW48_16275 [Phycisphaerae bacterium]|nr:hypothetical protein [Phycisphaerae bacterium]
MVKPWFIAVEKFGPESGETWRKYIEYSGLNQLKEVVSLDDGLCPEVIKELSDQDWQHNVAEDYVCFYFRDLDYLLQKVADYSNINILATISDPKVDCKDLFQDERFEFVGYDLVEVHGGTSALTNCGGFKKAFENVELSEVGLISSLKRAREIQHMLKQHYPEEHHANCDVWAIWKMKD